jgi:beta-galactosidase
MKRITIALAVLVDSALSAAPVFAAPPDSKFEIFPPAPAARSAIHWENGYFVINGEPTFISSGSIHYARVPRGLWRDRIWRLKQMGFKCSDS